ncbi:hypothetical protein A6M27_12480 [Acidithiobacillus thiooxidans]|uniref:hypothetical protein n=1 Tax=Acidithiobacillus thiooxidans TaxID=930 RepID=UPI0004661D80|nr:hypothetical protein [Acidithiobacillus thiooxidans]OCX69086.1 hypothetical protein A6O24_18990 [Acidithiobacillus thiooxidans]OCX83506.1 hypothetical protein A6O26_06785 [Acidithiobacillus thiooxidans]OCX86467.1 hypothetical protein A6M27_12480 [Acidithiobacillus thiooxidans]OFC42523.1 hypothetical protein BAE47_15320 [Acidithiobacillus thiooxidans]
MLSQTELSMNDFTELFSQIGAVRVLEQAGCDLDHLDDTSLLRVARQVQAPHTHTLTSISRGRIQP